MATPATLADLQAWIENYAGPILDAVMLWADGNGGTEGVTNAGIYATDPTKRTELDEIAARLRAARAAGALPAAYYGGANRGGRGVQPSVNASNWTAAVGNWTAGVGPAALNYPNW